MIVPAALISSAVLYSVWTLEFVLATRVHPLHAYTSEFAAFDQPYGWIFRVCDLAAGALVAAVGIAKFRDGFVWKALVVFGVATMLDSQWSLSCAPKSDAVCAAAEAAGSVPLTHQLHTVSSTTASTAAVVAIVAYAWMVRRSDRIAAALACVLVLSTVWTLSAVFLDSLIGLAQRIQLASFALSLLSIAWWTYRGRKCST